MLQLVLALQFPVNAIVNLDGVFANLLMKPMLLSLRCYTHPRIGFSTVGIVQLDSQPWVKGEHYDRQSN